MKYCPAALVAALVAGLATLGSSAWAQVGDGPVVPMTAPPTRYSSTPTATAVRPVPPAVPRMAQGTGAFGATSASTATRMTTDAREERRFLREAAAQSRFELEASKVVFNKSGNSAVRSLAASVINHQNTSGLELQHLLHSRGMALPMISNEQRKALGQLAKLTGTRLDAVYVQQVGLAQGTLARDYEKASVAMREPQINAWIVKTLPTTRYHLALAERALPGQPQNAKSNRASIKSEASRGPARAPQVEPPAQAWKLARPAGAIGVQPVAATLGDPVNASNTR